MDPFNAQFTNKDGTRNSIIGKGMDEVGQYSLKGEFNHANGRMKINKQSQRGTGNPDLNQGHTVFLRLEWSGATQEFVGTFHVNKRKLKASGQWVMRAIPQTEDVNPSEYLTFDKANQFYYANLTNVPPQQTFGQMPAAYPPQPSYNLLMAPQQYPVAAPMNQPYPGQVPQAPYNTHYAPQQYPAQPIQPQYPAYPMQVPGAQVQMKTVPSQPTSENLQVSYK